MEVRNPLFSSQIYPYLHQFLLDQKGCVPDGLDSQEVFAEVFNLCRRAATDQTPGENLASRYVDELRGRTGNNRLAELILCLSWVVLTVQEHPSYSVSTFTQRLQPLIRHASIYSKARQLAVSIRQHERHIQTDFLVTPKTYPDMKVQIDGDSGTGNSYTENTYNISNVETLAPNATTVVNKHYHISGPIGAAEEAALEAAAERAEADGQEPAATAPSRKKAKELVDTEVVREEILTFVSKVRPLLDDAWKADYPKIWEDILNMEEVKEKIYDPGKQKKTNFNQYLVGNILYFMFEDCGACSDDKEYNASEVCMALIGTTEHQLRKELSKFPPDEIKNRLHDYFTKKFEL